MTDILDPFIGYPEQPLSFAVAPPVQEQTRGAKTPYATVAAGLVVAAELGPLNEVLRGAAFTAGQVISQTPLMGAATFGMSTLLVEASAAAVAPFVLSDPRSLRAIETVRRTLSRIGYDPTRPTSRYTRAAATFLGGSVVGMALRKFDQPGISSAALRESGIKSSAVLAGVCAGLGAGGYEAIEFAKDNPMVGGGVVAVTAAVAAGRKVLRHSKEQPQAEIFVPDRYVDRDSYGIDYGLIADPKRLEHIAEVEQEIWFEKGYGSLEDYSKYIKNSRTFAAFLGDMCVGVTRMFRSGESIADVPPFLSEEMPFYDENERKEITRMAYLGHVEELGTAAVTRDFRRKEVNAHLWRLAYRDARKRNIEMWGIIMEPERVQRMNKKYGFTFRQLSEPVSYQGGDCAAHIMSLDEVDKKMHRKKWIQHFWFTRKKLHPMS